jgi:hypothetical protein
MSQGDSPLSAQLKGLSTTEKVTALRSAVSELSENEKVEVAKGLRPVLPLPSDPMKDRIWLIIVGSFAFVMVGAASVLGIGVFIGSTDATKQLTRADTILTVFMTVVGFLAGLLSPSPLGNKNG